MAHMALELPLEVFFGDSEVSRHCGSGDGRAKRDRYRWSVARIAKSWRAMMSRPMWGWQAPSGPHLSQSHKPMRGSADQRRNLHLFNITLRSTFFCFPSLFQHRWMAFDILL